MIIKTELPETLRGYQNNKNKNTGRTIASVLTNLFPNGTTPRFSKQGKLLKSSLQYKSMSVCPPNPADVFAFTAHLLSISGAFGHFNAVPKSSKKKKRIALRLSETDVKKAVGRGASWRVRYYQNSEPPPDKVEELWCELISYWEWPINNRVYHSSNTHPTWWKIAYVLMIASDEAASGTGFTASTNALLKYEDRQNSVFKQAEESSEKKSQGDEHHISSIPPTICNAADPDVVCVQPKSLVSNVGSSSRVFSHHLALLGPRGVVRTQWSRLSSYSETDDAAKGLNLLIIPSPDKLTADNFVPRKNEKGNIISNGDWRTFEIVQDWLEKGNLGELTQNLVKSASQLGEEIHGVVFPEQSLNRDVCRDISRRLDKMDGVEFLVAGTSQHCEGKSGNFVWCERFETILNPDNNSESFLSGLGFVQSKHHRWKLDQSQIDRYELDKLQPNYEWWEHINVGGRELNFVTFRANSIFSALICEDLARSDPCHEILRSVGPNLLFALLMDGPQIDARWPARYASYLSEDPGSAVLTVTSRGLSKMSNPESHKSAIAYFSDGEGNPDSRSEIQIPDNASATIVKLVSKPKTIASIDGRNKKLVRWTLAHKNPISHLVKDDAEYTIEIDNDFNEIRKEKIKKNI